MKILLVVEKEGTAIHRLAVMMSKCPWHDFKIVAVHPKRPNLQQLNDYDEGVRWADVVDYRYWKTAEMLQETSPNKKPKLLTHYNPYDLRQSGWINYKENVVVNTEQRANIGVNAKLIPLPVDTSFWKYTPWDDYVAYRSGIKKVLMVVNRIEGKKGVLEVAQAVKELGWQFRLIGSISDKGYFDRVMEANPETVFRQGISDKELLGEYMSAYALVCNSIDNFESGTMPILEAMAVGTPVITRKVGHVPDVYDGTNMIVRRNGPEDIEEIKSSLKVIDNDEFVKDLRGKARDSLRRRGLELYWWEYSKIYHRIVRPEPLVSIVMPIVGEPKSWLASAVGSMLTGYDNTELILVSDDDTDPTEAIELVKKTIRETTDIPVTIKHYNTALYTKNGEKTYGLARARNKAILESEGEYILFNDARLMAQPGSIEAMVNTIKDRTYTWLWGIKDGVKKGFVENFSMIRRTDIIKMGGFSDQITQYGGMTQEVRKRAELNNIAFQIVETAKAVSNQKSSSKWKRYEDIAKSKEQCYKLYNA